MKKEYINPTMEIVKIESLQMLTISGFEDSVDKEGVGGEYGLSRGIDDLWD